jgi:hypothetical protein
MQHARRPARRDPAARAAASARDAGIDLIRRVNTWLIAGAVAFAGVISLVASRSFHGRSLNTSSSAASARSPSESNDGVGNGGGGLQQPAQAPGVSAPSSLPVPVVSGGS